MIFAALSEAAERDELLLWDGGMCRFHRRRDGVVVIREILVLPSERGNGIGSRMVKKVASLHPGAVLRAACPAAYDANEFWVNMGFKLAGVKGLINTWERHP